MRDLQGTLDGIKDNSLTFEEAVDYLKFVKEEIPVSSGRTAMILQLSEYIGKVMMRKENLK